LFGKREKLLAGIAPFCFSYGDVSAFENLEMTPEEIAAKPNNSKICSESDLRRRREGLTERGVELDRDQVKGAYFATRVMSQRQQEAASALLKIFAQQLAMLSNQVIIQHENAEPPMITKAKAYIEEHYADDLRSYAG
jgi:hypothetical protein